MHTLQKMILLLQGLQKANEDPKLRSETYKQRLKLKSIFLFIQRSSYIRVLQMRQQENTLDCNCIVKYFWSLIRAHITLLS